MSDSTAVLLADPSAIRLNCIRPALSTIKLAVTTTASQAECPRCHRTSSRIHSHHIRRMADLPWHAESPANWNCTHGASAV